MNILLTGGAGDLGSQLTPILRAVGHRISIIDPVKPLSEDSLYHAGSILDQNALQMAAEGMDVVVHIAAWHGIHHGIKSEAEFYELNVKGTENVVHCWTEGRFENLLYISSSSVLKTASYYGETKRQAEACITQAALDHQLQAISLRPRGFIPHTNRSVYDSFQSWAQYFYTGAVHIDDVVQAVVEALRVLPGIEPGENPAFMVDRLPDFNDLEVETWDAGGPGSSFGEKFSVYRDLAQQHNLPIHQPPRTYDISMTQAALSYSPRYGLKDMLVDLSQQPFG
jgi:nucleoside-diphosphate-sugar epimerase